MEFRLAFIIRRFTIFPITSKISRGSIFLRQIMIQKKNKA